MTSLQGRAPKDTFKDLLQVSNSNSGIDGTLRNVLDGEATSSPLQLSTVAVNVDSGFHLGGVAVNASAADLNKTSSISTFGLSLVDDADASAARTTLGLGTLATQSDASVDINGGTIDGVAANLNSLTVDTNTLHVDTSNNRLGFGTTSPNNAVQFGNTAVIGQDANSLYVGVNFDASNQYFGGTNYAVQTMFDRSTGNYKVRHGARTTAPAAISWTDSFVVTPNSDVGIGATPPSDRRFYVQEDGFVIASLRASGGSPNFSRLEMGDDADPDVGWLQYNHSTNSLEFRVNASTALTIDSSQRMIPVLPTSSVGLPTGALWNDAGTVKVA